MEAEKKGISTLQGVSNSLEVLFALARADGPLSPAELAAITSINRTTVYRILETYMQYQIVEPDHDQKYRLGLGIWRLVQSAQKQHPVIYTAMPIITELWQRTKESVQLNLRFGDTVICMVGFESTHRLRVSPQVGDQWPLHITSRGRVILAHLSEKERKAYLQKDLQAFTKHSITDKAQLEELCLKIREAGYAISKGEMIEDAASIAAPVFFNGQVVGSIDVAGPLQRVETVDPAWVKVAGMEISELLK